MIFSNTKADFKAQTSQQKHESGTATVEVALLLPLYVFLLISMIFMASFDALNIRMIRAVATLNQKPGSQDDNDIPSDVVQSAANAFPNSIGFVEFHDVIDPVLFDSQELLEMYNEATYSVTGGYSLQGTEIVYSTSVSVTGVGALNEKYKLSDLPVREELTAELDKYLDRTETRLEMKMRLPFSQVSVSGSDNTVQTRTVVDFESNLWGNIVHEHRGMIRHEEGGDVFKRKNYLDDPSTPVQSRAYQVLWGEMWDPINTDQFKDFWNTQYTPEDL
jgi:hypothetical protein